VLIVDTSAYSGIVLIVFGGHCLIMLDSVYSELNLIQFDLEF
jgi:hypothetical protein